MAKLKPNVETHRIKALGYLLSKNLAQARLEINKAFEQAPKLKAVKETVAIINYFSSLSPDVLPSHLVQWPEPVGWLFIKRDDDSLIRLREAAVMFKELSDETDRKGSEKKILQCWYLACLANDPGKQEKAIDYCRELLQDDPTDFRVIAWATNRNYGLDLEPSEETLSSIIEEGKADISHVIALATCKLVLQKTVEAIEVLKNSKSQFKSQEEIRVWSSLYTEALINNGDTQAALTVINQSNLEENLYYDRMMVLGAIAQKTNDWQSFIVFLEDAYKKTGDTLFLFNCCNLMAQQNNWEYVAQRSKQLIDGLETPEALRLAATACHNNKQFDICLRLLDDHRNFFEGDLLPNELRRIRVSCQSMIGAIPEAIKEAETLINEDPSADNFLTLMEIYFEIGDLRRLAITARQHKEMPNLTQQQQLRIAHLVKLEDRDLAIFFWKKVISQDITDDLVGEVVTLGFQLGLDEELKPFLAKVQELGDSGKGEFTLLKFDDLISFFKEKKEHSKKISDAYEQGFLPIHVVVKELNTTLLEIFHYSLSENEKAPNPRNQFYLLARHGGRKIDSEFPNNSPQWRLNLDITSILLAAHLDILSKIENTFAPLRISKYLVPSLLKMKDNLTPHQPSRLQSAAQIIDIESQGLLDTWEHEITSSDKNAALIEEMGEYWAAFFEKAKKENGFTVCFLPLKTQGMSGPPTTLPNDADQYIINCRALVESLYKQGPLSKEEYKQTLEKLGGEDWENPNEIIPQKGSLIFLQDGIAEVLARADVLRTICDHFDVYWGKWEFDRIRSGLESQRKRDDLIDWLDRLMIKISDGIETGTYEMIPHDENEISDQQDQDLSERFLGNLLSIKKQKDDVIWSDDRFLNGYFHVGEVPIIGINEVLKGLVKSNSISDLEYYNVVTRLRASNVRFIPIEKEEILYYLSQARIENGFLIETKELSIMKRYIAACLLKDNALQIPPIPENTSNGDGEIAFIMSLLHTIPDTIISLWINGSSDEECIAQSNWLIDNIYLDYHGMLKTIDKEKIDQDDRYLAALSLSELINCVILFPFEQDENNRSKQRARYCDWLYRTVLFSRFETDPNLIVMVADMLKKNLNSLQEQFRNPANAVILSRILYNDLPHVLREELSLDTDFMAKIGFISRPIAKAFDLDFDPDKFIKAASEAMNGHEALLSTSEGNQEVKLIPFISDDGKKGIYIDESEAGKKGILDDTLELLLESSEEREAVLRRNRFWFDCPKQIFEEAIADIVSIEEPSRRVEEARSWKENSAAVYYSNLQEDLKVQSSFEISALQPPNIEGLLRHYRLTSEVETGSQLYDWLDNQAKDLIQDEGLKEAILRFSKFPIPFPRSLVNAVMNSPHKQRYILIKELIKSAGSPLTQIHFVHLLIYSSDGQSSFWRLGKKIIRHLFSEEGRRRFSASLSVLKWVNEELNRWSEFCQLPSHIRLLMVWAHANELYRIFLDLGVSDQSLEEMFEDLNYKISFEVFEQDSSYWYDIAHPRRIQYIPFLLNGLSYSIGDKADIFVDESLKNLFQDQNFAPQVLLDATLAQNNLHSFLGGDRGEVLSGLWDNETATRLTTNSLQELMEQALEGLKKKDNERLHWTWIHSILGDLYPYEKIIDRLREIILKTGFADLYYKDETCGIIAFQTACLQAKHIGNKITCDHLRSELFKIVEYLEDESTKSYVNSENSISKRNHLVALSESALNISFASGQKSQDRISYLIEILSQIIEIWKDSVPGVEFMVRRFCNDLPFSQSKEFWPLLIRLRAE